MISSMNIRRSWVAMPLVLLVLTALFPDGLAWGVLLLFIFPGYLCWSIVGLVWAIRSSPRDKVSVITNLVATLVSASFFIALWTGHIRFHI